MTTASTPATSPAQPGTLPQRDTIRLLLERSSRPNRTVPIRREFLQKGPKGTPTPGQLCELVRKSQPRALDLYLLVSAVTSGGDFDVTEWATTWARSVGNYDETAGPTTVSRAWKALLNLKLIERKRGEKGKATIIKLREDGSDTPYTPPSSSGGDPYFQLPYEYWDHSLNESLSLPGKAMLLITLSQRKERFTLPQDRMPSWYGISADTAGRGLTELQDKGVLAHVEDEPFDTLKTRTGLASRPVYSLLAPFTPRGLGYATPRSGSTADGHSNVQSKAS
ncbi:hypothetical protein AB0I22_02345 [Streptomyces sp. NPDC050610]|uniref:hypothetical protein n=1 Tax=Streptomyces sp. NPDC050610 TaxID=3157097 RepID=UPI003417657B